MLQECYRNSEGGFPESAETWIDPNLGLTTADSDEFENVCTCGGCHEEEELKTAEKSTQTALFNFKGEKEITKHMKFIACFIKLKALISSKDAKANVSLHEVLQIIGNRSCDEEEEEEESSTAQTSKKTVNLPKETIEYVLRTSDSERILRETVQALVSHMEKILKADFLETARCWRFSVYEMAVDILTEAVDHNFGIRRIVKSFLLRLLESFSDDTQRAENLLLESKALLVMTFCKSTYISVTSTEYVIEHLKLLNMRAIAFEKKHHRSNFVKNLWLLIRILEFSLESLKSKLLEQEIDKVLNKEPEMKNSSILELWKKHWRTDEMPKKTSAQRHWKMTMSSWLNALDEGLVNCVNHFPIAALAVERCKRLAVEILRICCPEEEGVENAAV